MKFRPCIDIHNGMVKQIVGGSICDQGDYAKENFVSDMKAADYAKLYQKNNLTGGHVILLNAKDSPYYDADLAQAREALATFSGGLQIGGGITAENAGEFIQMGASHVIVTSYVFHDGKIHEDRLEKLVDAVGKEHIVLDLSCRVRQGAFYVVTNRWQKFTSQPVNTSLLHKLAGYCDEFLVHAVDVEGTGSGVSVDLVRILAQVQELKVTYAGGIGSMDDLQRLEEAGEGKVDFTVGSALDLFGGSLSFNEIVTKYR